MLNKLADNRTLANNPPHLFVLLNIFFIFATNKSTV